MQIERLSKKVIVPPWVFQEHIARFNFASQFVKNKIVIDCACGDGIGSEIFAKARAKEVWGFDLDKKEIKDLAKVNINPIIKFQSANGLKLPLPDNFADVYISFETIEHINEDREYVKEAKRVLKKGGLFICSTPNRTITNPGKFINSKPWNKFHIREYSMEEFIILISGYFKISSVYGQNPMHFIISKINSFFSFLPFNFIIMINKFFKLFRFFSKNSERYKVCGIRKKFEYEYIIIVAKND